MVAVGVAVAVVVAVVVVVGVASMLIYIPDDCALGVETLRRARAEHDMTCRLAEREYMGEPTYLLSPADKRVVETEESK